MLAVQELLRSAAFLHGAPEPALVETHISWVILAGDYAYKIKKPVRLPFLDYSTLRARKHYCEEELRLNRRLAPELYEGVSRVVRTPHGLAVDQDGAVVDYAVRMRRFPAGQRLDLILAEGRLTAADLDRCARRIATMHGDAPRAASGGPFGTPEVVVRVVRDCLEALGDGPVAVREARRWMAENEPELVDRFADRLDGGWIRECHGDLHLANLACVDGRIVPFDAIEFDPALRWTDIQADAAFLLMDLWSRERPALGWRFYDTWLARTGDYEGVAVLRYYLIYRHLVRAKVDRIRLDQAPGDPHERKRVARRLAIHLGGIRDLLRPGRAALVLTHGLSASGKSTIAKGLAAELPMIRLRADLLRKRMAGIDPFDPAGEPPAGLYDPGFTDRVYDELARLAGLALDAGWNTIVDATFLTPARREPLYALARERGLPALCLHCRAPESELRRRIVARRRAGTDPSDADLAVLTDQMAGIRGPADNERDLWLEVDTTAAPEAGELAMRLRRRLWA
jgi:aminoglycoside phosphotransferase family enzyme/predicted kinase